MLKCKKSPHVFLEVYHILKYTDNLSQEEPTLQYHTGILTHVCMWDTLCTYFLGLRIQKTHVGSFQVINVARSDQQGCQIRYFSYYRQKTQYFKCFALGNVAISFCICFFWGLWIPVRPY